MSRERETTTHANLVGWLEPWNHRAHETSLQHTHSDPV